MTIDTHTHAWGPPSAEHPWVNGPLVAESVDQFSVSVVYEREDLLADMDAVGIDEAVVVGYPIYQWADNAYTVRAAAHDRLAGIVMVDPFATNAAEILERLLDQDGILGFRLGVMCPYDGMWQTFDYDVTWLRDAIEESQFWTVAQDHDALVQLLAHTSQLDQVRALVETYPDLRYVIDHFCHADAANAPDETEFAALGGLAAFENVGVKLSEIAFLSNETFPYPDAHPYLHWLLDQFGRERLFWGSDFPNVSHPTYGGMTYDESLSWLDRVDALSEADRHWLTDRAFRQFSRA